VKLGYSTLGCPGWTLERAVEAAKEYGYSGLELRLLDDQVISPALLAANRERIRRAFGGEVELASLGSSVRFSNPDRDEKRAQEADCAALIAEAKALGAPIIRVFGGKRPDGVTVEQGIESVAESLKRLAPAAEDAGVKLVLETHDDFASAKTVADALARVSSPAVGALWDTHHPYRMGESAAEVWKLLASRLFHTHVKDARAKGDGWDLVLLGEGEVPVKEAVQTLERSGWQGYLVVEWEKKWHMEIEEPEVALPQHVQLLRQYLAEA
jgi:sugar phosphate isomerase/epimerase